MLRGGVQERAVLVQLELSVVDVFDDRQPQLVSVGVDVIGQDARCGDGETHVLEQLVTVVGGDDDVALGADEELDPAGGRLPGLVRRLVREHVDAVEVLVRLVGEAAVRIEGDELAPVGRGAERGRQLSFVGVGVVGQNPFVRADHDLGVLRCQIGVVGDRRRVLLRAHLDGDRGHLTGPRRRRVGWRR